MVKDAGLRKEIAVTEKDRAGILADLSKILAEHGINIEGVAGYAANNEAKIMVVTEDDVRAQEAIKKAGYKQVSENEVVQVYLINKAGALKAMSARLASAGIDLKYAYGTICSEGCPATMILATSDNKKALAVLKQK